MPDLDHLNKQIKVISPRSRWWWLLSGMVIGGIVAVTLYVAFGPAPTPSTTAIVLQPNCCPTLLEMKEPDFYRFKFGSNGGRVWFARPITDGSRILVRDLATGAIVPYDAARFGVDVPGTGSPRYLEISLDAPDAAVREIMLSAN